MHPKTRPVKFVPESCTRKDTSGQWNFLQSLARIACFAGDLRLRANTPTTMSVLNWILAVAIYHFKVHRKSTFCFQSSRYLTGILPMMSGFVLELVNSHAFRRIRAFYTLYDKIIGQTVDHIKPLKWKIRATHVRFTMQTHCNIHSASSDTFHFVDGAIFGTRVGRSIQTRSHERIT